MTRDWDHPRPPAGVMGAAADARLTVVQVLAELVAVATFMVEKPHVAFGQRARLAALIPQVTAAVGRPCEGTRFIDDIAILLVTALEHLAGPDRPAPKWIDLAAHLLASVREDLRNARESELNERATP